MPDEFDAITVGLLHPGEMGAAVGASTVSIGRRVVWASEGRGPSTRERAAAARIEDVRWLSSLVGESDIVLSICPPHAALDVARKVADSGFEKLYVDANAVSPQTARDVQRIVEQAGAQYVDGGIVGGPPRPGSGTRLYLSGEEAPRAARALEGGPLGTVVLDGPAGAASALKMCYAAWTKGTAGLLVDILALARHESILPALQAEWAQSQPALERRAASLGSAAAKAWRWVGEMEEIAATFEAAGLPGDFHRGAAEVYRRLERFKDDPQAPAGAELAEFLLPERVSRDG